VILLVTCRRAEIVGIKPVETRAAHDESAGRQGGREFLSAKGREHFADQRCSQTMRKLTIVFFIGASMPG